MRLAACLLVVLAMASPLAGQTFHLDSQGGSDTADGLSPATAWRTTAPLTGRTFSGGQAIRFKRGGEWRAGLVGLQMSGSVVIGDYGDPSLPLPILNGADLAPGGWVSQGSQRYTLSGLPAFTQVIVDGTRITPARSPNTGYWTIDSVISPTQFTSAQATAFFEANGIGPQTDIYVKHEHWRVDRRKVIGFDAPTGVISLDLPLSGTLKAKWGFYLGGRSAMVDQPGEWALESGVLTLSLADAPANHAIELSRRPFGISSAASAALMVENLEFRNFDDAALSLFMVDITIHDVTIRNSRSRGINANGDQTVTIRDGVIEDSYLNGINVYGSAVVLIERMTLRRNGALGNQPVMHQQAGMMLGGQNGAVTVTDSVIEDSGHTAIHGSHVNGFLTVARNTITRYCVYFSDCGGIKFGRGVGSLTPGAPRVADFSENTIRDGIGNIDGTSTSYGVGVSGIYLDENASGVHVHHNTIDRAPGSAGNGGVKFHRGNNHLTEDNTIYQYATWPTMAFIKSLDTQVQPPAAYSMGNNVTRNNDFIVEQIFNTSQDIIKHNYTGDGINNYGTFSNNTITIGEPPPGDTTPPTVTITEPSENVQRGSPVTIRATVTDPSGITGVSFLINDVYPPALCTDLAAPYECVWQVPSTMPATYLLRVNGTDEAGNTGTATKTVTAADEPAPPPPDTTLPEVKITSPAGSTVPRNSVVAISADVTDNVAVTAVDFRVGVKGQPTTSLCVDLAVPYTCVWNVPSPANVVYVIWVNGIDAAQNVGSLSKTVTSK